MGCTFALALAVMLISGVLVRAQETPKTLVKHVLNGTYHDTTPGVIASCNTAGCVATSNMYSESIPCPGAAGVSCTYEVNIAAKTGLQSGRGLYQFLIDGAIPNGGETDNSFFDWGQGQNGGGLTVSSAYSVTSQVKNASANQLHSIVVNLGCDMGNPGCTAASGSSSLTVRVLKP